MADLGGEGENHSVVNHSLRPHWLYCPWNSPGQNTGMGSFPQGIFPTQGSNPGLPRCGRILYQLSHQGSPRILKWVAYPFSRGSSWSRNQTGVSCIAGGFLTNWAIRNLEGRSDYILRITKQTSKEKSLKHWWYCIPTIIQVVQIILDCLPFR